MRAKDDGWKVCGNEAEENVRCGMVVVRREGVRCSNGVEVLFVELAYRGG